LVIQAEENYHRAWGAILPAINGSYSYFHQNAPDLTGSGNSQDSLSPEWKAEVQRRCREVDDNLVALRDAESVFKTAFASLG
jgi:outer membrane protein TolC